VASDINKLLFVPIDIDLSNLIDIPISPSSFSPEGASFWDHEILLQEISYGDQKNNWKDLSNDKKIIRDLGEKLAFTELHHVRLSVQNKPVLPHVDVIPEKYHKQIYQRYLDQEPGGYRLVLKGSKDSLFVINSSGELINAELPSMPCLYAINSTTCKHFIVGDLGREVIYFRGFLDQKKHNNLLEKSLLKYSEFSIWDQ
jgi:hypothetical protein